MSDIFRVNNQNTTSEKIRLLNEMIIILEGLNSQGKFDVNELTQLFTDIGYNRKFLRNQSLGNTLSTYTGWTHLLAESGYSIWKFTPTTYTYNSLNALYLDNKLIDNKGLANSESITSFAKVFLYNGDSGTGFIDNSTEAATEVGTAFELMNSINDYLYIGAASTFAGMKFEFGTRGSNHTLVVEYWKGATWEVMTANDNSLVDNTSNFESDGAITFAVPADWATTAVNSSTQYWIRISSSTAPVTEAKAYLIIPNDSVPGLLALSSDNILKEEWAWCSLGSSIYVTIRNSGNTNYEGNYFIISASSATNLQNYFIYNHGFTADYQDSGYSATTTSAIAGAITGTVTIDSGTTSGDVVYISGVDTFRAADATDNSKVGIGVYILDGTTDRIFISGNQTLNTVGNADIVAGDLLFLSETDGKVTKTPPSSSGNIVQIIGRAKDNESASTVDVILDIDANPSEFA